MLSNRNPSECSHSKIKQSENQLRVCKVNLSRQSLWNAASGISVGTMRKGTLLRGIKHYSEKWEYVGVARTNFPPSYLREKWARQSFNKTGLTMHSVLLKKVNASDSQ